MSAADLTGQLDRAEELITLRRAQSALDILAPLRAAYPDDARIPQQLSRALYTQKNYSAARTEAAQAIALDPDDALNHFLLGIAAHQQSDLSTAMAALNDAITLSPQWSLPHSTAAQVLAARAQYDEAFRAADTAVRLAPEDPSTHFAMGFVLQETNPAQAHQAYSRCLELDPEHQAAKHNLATLDLSAGKWDTGAKGLAAVLRDDPQAKLPVMLLDQRFVQITGRLHLATFVIWFALIVTAGVLAMDDGPANPWAPLAAAAVFLVGCTATVLLARHGIRPIQNALPRRPRQFIKGYVARETLAAIWAGALLLIWLLWLGLIVTAFVANPMALVGIFPTIFLLVLGVLLSWIRVPLAARRIRNAD